MKKIGIITQQDYFFIPENIKKIAERFESNSIKCIIVIDNKGSINNKKNLFIRGFGLRQTIRYGLKVLKKKFLSLLYFFHISSDYTNSIKGIADYLQIPFLKVRNINNEFILDHLESYELDIIISFSAPVVFKERLLNIPKLGCINLHCSHLPYYSGLFPSFWVLYKNEKHTGCTIHKMDDKIDNGDILKQKKVEISPDETIFSLLSKTKSIGGEIMVQVIEEMFEGKSNPVFNQVDFNSYYSWPTLEDLYLFRKNGGKLV